MSDQLTPPDQELMESIKAAYRPYCLPPPRQRGRRRLWSGTAALTVALAGVIALAVVTGSPSALASWTAAPTSSDPDELPAATVDACREQASRRIRVGEQADWPDDPNLTTIGTLPLVAYDERGEASAALLADQGARAAWICVIVPVAGQPPYTELGGGSALEPEDLGPVEIWAATAGWNFDYGGRWGMAGRVNPEIEQLTIVTEDDREVVATIDDGWFLAWWPSEAEPVRLDLHVSGGELVDAIDLGDRYTHEPSCKLMFLNDICLWR